MNSLRFKKNYYYDYGLKISSNKNYVIKNKFCSIPYPLAIGYALSLAIAGKVKTIKVAGFDGYDQSDVNQDETDQIFKYFKSNIQNIKLPVSQKLD